MKKTAIAAAILLVSGAASAAPVDITATLLMLDSAGGFVGEDASVTGSYDPVATTWAVSSTVTFIDHLWTAYDGVLFGEGTHTVDTIEGGIYTFTVGAGQIGGHMLFDWSTSTNIDVINVWDADGNSIDVDGDGVLGLAMIDGPLLGFNANFHLSEQPQIVPVPAAVWLFGSGLLGLVGIARRRKVA